MNRSLRQALEAVEAQVRDVPLDRLSTHRGGKWSASEIVEHLARACAATSTPMQRCLQTGRPLATPSTWRQRIASIVVIRLGRFPRGREAPPFARPRGLPPDQALQLYRHQLEKLERTLERCEARFGPHKALVDHPFFGGFSVIQWRKYHWLHIRHHLKQVRARVTQKSAD